MGVLLRIGERKKYRYKRPAHRRSKMGRYNTTRNVTTKVSKNPLRIRVDERLRRDIDELHSTEEYFDYDLQDLVAHLIRAGIRRTQQQMRVLKENELFLDEHLDKSTDTTNRKSISEQNTNED